jgi:hypothetical protein
MKNLIVKKHKLRRKWLQSRIPYDKNLLNRVSEQLSEEIKNIKQTSINEFLTDITYGVFSLESYKMSKKTNSSIVTHQKSRWEMG